MNRFPQPTADQSDAVCRIHNYVPTKLRVVQENSGQWNDPSRPGYTYAGSDYVGTMRRDGVLVLDARGHNGCLVHPDGTTEHD